MMENPITKLQLLPDDQTGNGPVNKSKEFCRACMGKLHANQDTSYIFHEHTSEIFVKCTSLKITPSDGLPSHLCLECYGLLLTFDAFRTKCIVSDDFFRENLKIKKDHNDAEPSFEIDEHQLLTNIFVLEKHADIKEELKPTERATESVNYDNSSDSNDSFMLDNKVNNDRPQIKNEKSPQKRSTMFCDICNKSFYKKHLLLKHLREHTGLKVGHLKDPLQSSSASTVPIMEDDTLYYACSYENCSRKYAHMRSLRTHIKYVHLKIPRPPAVPVIKEDKYFVCSYENCTKKYTKVTSLRSHIQYFHLKIPNKLNYVCEICGSKFSSNFTLKQHTNIHTGDKPYECTVCLKKFRTKGEHSNHVKRHEEKKFICSYCGSKKTNKHELNLHINTHTREKTFPCQYCPQILSSYNTLLQHKFTRHLGRRSYACTFCDKSFGMGHTLKKHILRLHTKDPVKRFACDLCEYKFFDSYQLRRHMKVHYKVKK